MRPASVNAAKQMSAVLYQLHPSSKQWLRPPSPRPVSFSFCTFWWVCPEWLLIWGWGSLVKPRPEAVGWGWVHMRPFVRNPWSEGLDDQLIPMESGTWGSGGSTTCFNKPPRGCWSSPTRESHFPQLNGEDMGSAPH